MSVKTCPRCRGQMFLEDYELGQEWACFNCGHRIDKGNMEVVMTEQNQTEGIQPVPTKPSNRYVCQQYYDDNKEAILFDFDLLGEKAMMKRWCISQATWYCKRKDGTNSGLAVRFGVVARGESAKKKRDICETIQSKDETKPLSPESLEPLGETPEESSKQFPKFPEFDSTWPESVMVKWLDIYQDLSEAARFINDI